MKKLLKYILLSLPLWGLGGCDKGFDELNINKTAALAVNPAFILNNATVNSAYSGGSLLYEIGIVQQMITPNEGVLAGANFNQDIRDNTAQNWQKYYRTVVRNTQDVIDQTKALPARSNLTNMARILQANAFMILTMLVRLLRAGKALVWSMTSCVFLTTDR